MEQIQTPVSRKNPAFNRLLNNAVSIPGSPAMQCIGMGTGVNVYSLARSPVAGQIRSPWAIKKLNRRITSSVYEHRLVAEADVLQCLKHPNIVGFRGVVEDKDGRKCLAMEECETSLGELIEGKWGKSKDPFSTDNIMTVANDICKALCYLHELRRILHGDLKSGNILIRGDFEVAKLCDFGVTVKLKSNGVALRGQRYIGTECWSAPEVFKKKGTGVTTKAEIFSFGLVIWEMLALRAPHTPEFLDDSTTASEESFSEENFRSKLGTRPELPTGLSPEYEDVVRMFNWCCEADPDARPSATRLMQFLQTLSNK